MAQRRRLPLREYVFIGSLLRHGFRLVNQDGYLKYRVGYVIISTQQEDSSGVDFFVKMPRDRSLYPIQITQRGIEIYEKYRRQRPKDFSARSDLRIKKKRLQCKRNGVAFILVRDFTGDRTNPHIAWSDIEALRHGIQSLWR